MKPGGCTYRKRYCGEPSASFGSQLFRASGCCRNASVAFLLSVLAVLGLNAPVFSQSGNNTKNTQIAQNTQNRIISNEKNEVDSDDLLGASTNLRDKKEALKKIPWNELSENARAKLRLVLNEQTLYRRLPQQSIYCEPCMYNFMLEHPEVVVAIWEKLGVSQISLKPQDRPGTYLLKESVGSVGVVEVLYQKPEISIVYSKGSYRGPVIPKAVEGETILLLQNKYFEDESGEPYIITQLDAFVKIHNFGIDVFAKLLAPLLGRIADNNFEQTLAFIGNVSDAAQTNPEAIKRLGFKLETIPKEVREELARTAYLTAQNAIDRAGDGALENSPYGRYLTGSQQEMTPAQWEEFERDRLAFLQKQQEEHARSQGQGVPAPLPEPRMSKADSIAPLPASQGLAPSGNPQTPSGAKAWSPVR